MREIEPDKKVVPADYLVDTKEVSREALYLMRSEPDRMHPYIDFDLTEEAVQMTSLALLKVGKERQLTKKRSLLRAIIENAYRLKKAEHLRRYYTQKYRVLAPRYTEPDEGIKKDDGTEYPLHVWETVLMKAKTFGEAVYLVGKIPADYLPALNYIDEPVLREIIDQRIQIYNPTKKEEDDPMKIYVSDWPTKFIESLTPLQQRVVGLRKMGRSYDEINASLHRKGNYAAVILQRVKKKYEKWSSEDTPKTPK